MLDGVDYTTAGNPLRALVEHQQISRCFTFTMSISAGAEISEDQAPLASGERVMVTLPNFLSGADVFYDSSVRTRHLFVRRLSVAPRCVSEGVEHLLHPHPPPPHPDDEQQPAVSRKLTFYDMLSENLKNKYTLIMLQNYVEAFN